MTTSTCRACPPARAASALFAAMLLCAVSHAGILQLGQPIIEGNQYIFPVTLSGGEDSVTALNFTLAYDPAVFRAVDASAGTQARITNKVVTAHAPAEGVFNVVMMGFNQQTLDSGEVARIILERIGGDGGASSLSINNPTLATWDGGELPSQGRGLRVNLGKEDAAAELSEPTSRAGAAERGDAGRTGERETPETNAVPAESANPVALASNTRLHAIPALPGPTLSRDAKAGNATASAAARAETSATESPTASTLAQTGTAAAAKLGGSALSKPAATAGTQAQRAEAVSEAVALSGGVNAVPGAVRVERSGEITGESAWATRLSLFLIVPAGALAAFALGLFALRAVLFR